MDASGDLRGDTSTGSGGERLVNRADDEVFSPKKNTSPGEASSTPSAEASSTPDAAASAVSRTWVGLLRGVNVGGNTIKSAELAACLTTAGFSRVKTVLASGNVLVESSDTDAAAVRRTLEAAIDARYGYGVEVIVLPHDRMHAVIDGYPFDEVAEKHPYVTFATSGELMQQLAAEASALQPSEAGERIAPGDGVMYWEVTKGSSLDNPFSKLTSRARFRSGTEALTTRNLRTLRKLEW